MINQLAIQCRVIARNSIEKIETKCTSKCSTLVEEITTSKVLNLLCSSVKLAEMGILKNDISVLYAQFSEIWNNNEGGQDVKEVEIYFISLVDDSDGRKRTQYWGTHCTGKDNAIVATNYDSIMSKLIEIMNMYEETGYFYN